MDEQFRSKSVGPGAAVAALALIATAPAAADVAVHKLSDGGAAHEAAFALGGEYVIWDRLAGDADELFSVPVEGGPSQQLNQTLDGSRTLWTVSQDGAWVVMSSDDEVLYQRQVYSVPAAGGERIRLTPPGGSGVDAVVTPDSTTVVYYGSDATGAVELYRVPIAGGESTPITGPTPLSRAILDFRISPDGQWVVYVADQDADDVFELYSVPIGGGTPVKLNPPFGPERDVLGYTPRFSPDSARVTYVADQDADEVYELYTVPAAGGTPVKLNRPLVAEGDLNLNGYPEASHEHSPDGQWVVYSADGDVDEVYELYAVPATGGPVVKLNPPLVEGGDCGPYAFMAPFYVFTPDSSRVVYRADQEVDDVTEVWSVPIGGGPAARVSDPPAPGYWVDDFRLSATGDRVFYVAAQETPGVWEIFAAPVTGGGSTRFNAPMEHPDGDAFQFVPGDDGHSILYLADQEEENKPELYFATEVVFADGFETGDTGRWSG